MDERRTLPNTRSQPMSGLALALGVIVFPGVVSLLLVRRFGPAIGVMILLGMLVWLGLTYMAARNLGNTAIQPDIFGGQTIGYSQNLGIRDMIWALFVLTPATLWAAIALLIGRASYRNANRTVEGS